MKIGLIAGGGQFPIIFAKAARAKGFSIYAVAHQNETDSLLEEYVDEVRWIYLGQIKKLIKFFKSNQVTEAVMMGTIAKARLFKELRPDTKAISLIAGMRHTLDDGILRSLAGMLEKEGIVVRSSTFLLPNLLAEKGCWTKRKPSRTEKRDITLGWEIAKEVGRLDIGQCVVVGGGSILAVEAIDGTDATIMRGGKLGSGNATVVKVCKPDQDLRFDIPAIGLETIKTMHAADVKMLAIEAGKAVVFEKEKMIALADKWKMSIIAMEKSEDITDSY
ncbi:MAG: UDP-2,3-diacylglucosamine diphosphatase LpxI [Desulfobacterales bacterium]